MEGRISREEFIRIYKVELSFLEALEESGLLHPEVEENHKYIRYEELPQLEKYRNWYYELEVNMPGIEVIHNLLAKIDRLHKERQQLLHKLRLLDDHFNEDFEFFEEL